MADCVLYTTNIRNYDVVNPPPVKIPSEWHTVYICDSELAANEAIRKGWKETFITHEIDKEQNKRSYFAFIGRIRCKAVHFECLSKYKYVFFIDANVVQVGDWYTTWANHLFKDDCCLLLSDGYYSGGRNSIRSEFN